MLRRAFAIFLAMVTFWSALASQEAGLPGPAAQLAHAASLPVGGDSSGGSIEDHHLDDRPGQPAGEHAADHPAWPPAAHAPILAAAAGSGIVARALPTPSGTVPGVPQRPPRS